MRRMARNPSCLSILMLTLMAAESARSRPQVTFMDTPQVDFNDCNQQTICTREFLPTLCMANGMEIKGSNRCEALLNLRREACRRGILVLREDIRCRNVSSRSAFEAY